MITSLKNRLLTAALVLSSLSLASAQSAPSGSLSFSFDPASNPPLYDLSGDFSLSQPIQGAGTNTTELSFDLENVYMDRSGRLSYAYAFDTNNYPVVFTGASIVTIGSNAVAAVGRLSGNVTRNGNVTKAVFSVRLTGKDTFGQVDNVSFSIALNYNLEVTSAGLIGTVKGTANLSKLGSGRINSPITLPLPPGMTGAWGASLSVVPLKRLTGSGTIVLSNGRALPANLTGSFSSKNGIGISRIALSGTTTNAAGSSLNLTLLNDGTSANGFDVIALKGRILGQTISQ